MNGNLKDIEIWKDEIDTGDYKLEIDIIASKNRKEFANPCLLYGYGRHNKTITNRYNELLIGFAINMQENHQTEKMAKIVCKIVV